MFAAAVVVFREVLEAALVVCVILAAVRGIKGAFSMIFAGIFAGAVGAGVVAIFTRALASAFEGNGQEIFGAVVLFTVVGLLAWHIIWMQKHGREMVAQMKRVGEDVRSGKKPLVVLAAVVALAVLREGSEIVLFLQGMLSASPGATVLGGFLFGLAMGVGAGGILYWGLVKLPISQMFRYTNVLLALIAAGMAARGAGKLIQAGYLPSLEDPVWNTTDVLSDDSLPGQFLSALTGYMAQPSGMQLVFYGVTIAAIAALAFIQTRKTKALAA